MVVVECEHLCMTMRGVKQARQPGRSPPRCAAIMRNPATRAEAMACILGGRGDRPRTPAVAGLGERAAYRAGPSPTAAERHGHGRPQRHARLVLRRRSAGTSPAAAIAHGTRSARRRGRPARRRRGVHPSGRVRVPASARVELAR
jgi:hypothetical protein